METPVNKTHKQNQEERKCDYKKYHTVLQVSWDKEKYLRLDERATSTDPSKSTFTQQETQKGDLTPWPHLLS